MRKLFYSAACIVIAGLTFGGCSDSYKELTEELSVNNSLSELKILEGLDINAPEAVVDFTATPVTNFTAKFSRKAKWVLTLNGGKGWQRVIRGESSSLNESTAQWNGSVDVIPMVKDGDLGTAVLQVEGLDEKIVGKAFLRKDFSIAKRGDVDLSNALLFGNFEPITKYPLRIRVTAKSPSGQLTYGFRSNTYTDGSGHEAAEGSFYWDMKGTPGGAGDDIYYIGTSNINANIFRAPFKPHFDLSGANGDPTQLYFNIMVYSYGLHNTRIGISFNEDDNNDGVAVPDSEDVFRAILPFDNVDWTPGWKLISVKYSETQHNEFATQGGTLGNNIKQIDRITDVNISLVPVTAGIANGEAHLSIDYPCFTWGAPLKP
ncbi:MAG: hypothetical protein V4543_12635 [Bacteroidota bacterium]